MILDKMGLMQTLWKKVGIWTLFGLTNAFCFGLSYLMNEKDYKNYFAYRGDGYMN